MFSQNPELEAQVSICRRIMTCGVCGDVSRGIGFKPLPEFLPVALWILADVEAPLKTVPRSWRSNGSSLLFLAESFLAESYQELLLTVSLSPA